MPTIIEHNGYKIIDGMLTLDNLNIRGDLDLKECFSLTSLPEGLKVENNILLHSCKALRSLPSNLEVGGSLNLSRCVSLQSLPENLNVPQELDLEACTAIFELPVGLKVGGSLFLDGCSSITHLPDDIQVKGSMHLVECISLKALPHGLAIGEYLEIDGCSSLKGLPADLKVGTSEFGGRLHLGDVSVCEESLNIVKKLPKTVWKSCIGKRVIDVADHYLLRGTYYADLIIADYRNGVFSLKKVSTTRCIDRGLKGLQIQHQAKEI